MIGEDGARSERVALALTDVSKRFGSTQALRDVSFRVRRGTVHAPSAKTAPVNRRWFRYGVRLSAPIPEPSPQGDPPA